MSKPLEDYGLIGNMMSAALVGSDGSIDWLCLPRFDSPACLAALLGTRDNGHWQIAPKDSDYKSSQRYLPDTAVLETRFETTTGVVTVTDFMPFSDDEGRLEVVRVVHCERGEVPMRMELLMRFNYGEILPWVRRRTYGLSFVAGPSAIELFTSLPLDNHDMKTFSDFVLRKGETVPVTLSYHASHKPSFPDVDAAVSLERTTEWWRGWIGRCVFSAARPRWTEAVNRSLITLKLLTFEPTGGIVAAPTTSLPEKIGGPRNWDYRFCWLRDSALTLYALINAGYRSEAEAWRQWVQRATAGHPKQIQIMYGLYGERWLPEIEVPWLSGYENSTPVRVGNGAADQLQLDIFGELAHTLYAARRAGLGPAEELAGFHSVLLEYLETIWQSHDNGIWEMRGPPRAFTHSRAMCWVAFDRATKAIEEFSVPGDLERWRGVRDTIHAEVCEKGFNSDRNSFTQYYGGDAPDASLLLLPLVGFLPVDDPRIVGTIKAIEEDLLKDGFVQRYATDNDNDGVGGGEGAFLACSFWLVDAYVLAGRHEEATALFEKLLSLRNGLGLLAEEYDPVAKRLVGNYPQAFSHLGLINTAHNLVRRTESAQAPAKTGSKPPPG